MKHSGGLQNPLVFLIGSLLAIVTFAIAEEESLPEFSTPTEEATNEEAVEEKVVKKNPEEPTPMPEKSMEEKSVDKEPDGILDKAHESVSEYVIDVADNIDKNLDRLVRPEELERNQTFDQFFGDRSLEETDSRARVMIGLGLIWSDEDGFEFDRDISGKIDLPRTEKRLKFVFDNLNEDKNSLSAFNKNQNSNKVNSLENGGRNGSAGIQARLGEIFNVRFTADAGMDFKPEPVPEVKLSAGIPWQWGKTDFKFRQRVYWESDDGFGEKTSLEIRRYFGESFLIFSETAGVWSEISEGVDLGQTILLRKAFHKNSTIGLTLGASAHTEPETAIDAYLIRIPLRQEVYKEWIYIVLEPGVDFKDENDWEALPLVSLMTEFHFGRL